MLIVLLSTIVVSGYTDPEAVVTTAPRGEQSVALDALAPVADAVPPVSGQAITPHGLSTAQQIDRWVGQRSLTDKPFSDDGPLDAWGRPDDRKMHGEVSAVVGTGDYTAWSASLSIPVGENGRVDLSYSQSKNSPYGYGYGYPGYGPDAIQYGPGYRGALDPFFLGSGIIHPGARTGFGLRYESDSAPKRSRDD